MEIRKILFQFRHKITAQKAIRLLATAALFLWLMTYVYLFSNRSNDSTFNYEMELLDQKAILIGQLNNIENPYCSYLMSHYQRLCQIDLCQNNLSSAKHCLDILLNFPIYRTECNKRIDVCLFAANIYRDFGDFKLAQAKYEEGLAIVNSTCSQNTLEERDSKLSKAKIFNNIGTTYFLQAKKALNKIECKEKYVFAKKYFEKALQTLNVDDYDLNKTFQSNLEQCLTEMKFLD